MKEYIEREAARDLMEQALADEWEIQYADDRLDEIPAADVVEVSTIHDAVYEAMQVLNSIYSAKRIGNADYMDLMGAISLIA